MYDCDKILKNQFFLFVPNGTVFWKLYILTRKRRFVLDPSNEKTEKISTLRTYRLLKAGLFHLLMEMPFEKISLTEICTHSLVPRSTFYRYFEDKYDLLCYCLQTFFDEANLDEDVLYLRNVDSMKEFLWKIIRIMDQNQAAFYKIYVNNKDGAFMDVFRNILIQILTEKLKNSEAKGCRLKISPSVFTYLLADFHISIGRCYLESGDSCNIEEFVHNVCLFADKDFFTVETRGGR